MKPYIDSNYRKFQLLQKLVQLNTLHINPGAAGHHGWHKERTLIKLTIDGSDMRDLEVIELGKFKVQ